MLFSIQTGDAWILDPAGQLAARLAYDGDPLEFYIGETETKYMRLAGKDAIASKTTPSSTKTTKRSASSQSEAI